MTIECRNCGCDVEVGNACACCGALTPVDPSAVPVLTHEDRMKGPETPGQNKAHHDCALCTNQASRWTSTYGWLCNACLRNWNNYRDGLPSGTDEYEG